jgi:hypothetical protein
VATEAFAGFFFEVLTALRLFFRASALIVATDYRSATSLAQIARMEPVVTASLVGCSGTLDGLPARTFRNSFHDDEFQKYAIPAFQLIAKSKPWSE